MRFDDATTLYLGDDATVVLSNTKDPHQPALILPIYIDDFEHMSPCEAYTHLDGLIFREYSDIWVAVSAIDDAVSDIFAHLLRSTEDHDHCCLCDEAWEAWE